MDNLGDKICVRPMGSMECVVGTFISVDKGEITIKLENGTLLTIIYGSYLNYNLK